MATSSPTSTTPFDVFTNIVQFYPKLTASIAFGAISAFGRLLPGSPSVSEAPAAPPQSPQVHGLFKGPEVKDDHSTTKS